MIILFGKLHLSNSRVVVDFVQYYGPTTLYCMNLTHMPVFYGEIWVTGIPGEYSMPNRLLNLSVVHVWRNGSSISVYFVGRCILSIYLLES